jgi:hypothetical protein
VSPRTLQTVLVVLNIRLGFLFSRTCNLRSLKGRDNFEDPYKTSGKIIILYILFSSFWKAGGTVKVFEVKNIMHPHMSVLFPHT